MEQLDNLSKHLQTTELAADSVVFTIKQTRRRLNGMRCENEFAKIWNETMRISDLKLSQLEKYSQRE